MSTITASNVDLSNCDREQIQFSGAVQPHGCMLIVEEPSLRILQASVNASNLLGLPVETLSMGNLRDALGTRAAAIANRLQHEALDNGPVYLVRSTADETISKLPLNVFAHRSGGATIFEFEVVPPGDERSMLDLYSELRATLSQLQATKSLQALFDMAVAQIRHFTGFERVMVYKFLEDGSGHVMAECTADGFEPYLGLHYPASDIPAPARRLFALAWQRHLPNVDYQPIPLAPELNPTTGKPVDLSYAFLRSVSVMYSEYLKNMGVKATMVMPLMKEGKLWGLISCMHETFPRHVPYEARMAAEFLAHTLSLMMAAKEDAESFAYRLRMKAVLDRMILALHLRSDLHAGLARGNGPDSIATYVECGGSAVVTEDKVTCLGATPPESALRELASWLAAGPDLIMATDRLPEIYPQGATLSATAAGLLAARMSKRRSEFVMWFRPEQPQTVSWAGDPKKPVEFDIRDGLVNLRPRVSFARWKESVLGRSRPWADFEVKAAADLRWAVVEVILAGAEQTELSKATFPKRGQGDQQVETMLKLTKRMVELLESQQYSRTGRTDLILTDCDLDTLLDEALAGLASQITEAGTQVRRPGKLPKVKADRERVREVLTNLVSNAIKYNDKPERWVEIGLSPVLRTRTAPR